MAFEDRHISMVLKEFGFLVKTRKIIFFYYYYYFLLSFESALRLTLTYCSVDTSRHYTMIVDPKLYVKYLINKWGR